MFAVNELIVWRNVPQAFAHKLLYAFINIPTCVGDTTLTFVPILLDDSVKCLLADSITKLKIINVIQDFKVEEPLLTSQQHFAVLRHSAFQ